MARKTEVRYVNFYTAGSEALKFDPKPAEKKQEVKNIGKDVKENAGPEL